MEHFQYNGASPFFLLFFYVHFQGQTFCIVFHLRISGKWWDIEQTLLLVSNRKSFIWPWHWPKFSKLKICNINISGKLCLVKKMRFWAFIEVDICQWMALLHILYSVILIYVFKINHLKRFYLKNSKRKMHAATFIEVDFRPRIASLRMTTSRPWHKF